MAVNDSVDASIFASYNTHSSGQRVNTNAQITLAIRAAYPKHHLIINADKGCDLLAFANAGQGHYQLRDNGNHLIWLAFTPPHRRHGNDTGTFDEQIKFGVYDYTWQAKSFIIHIVDGFDGTQCPVKSTYLLSPQPLEEPSMQLEGFALDARSLLQAATMWGVAAHNEVFVFDQGTWTKSAELWRSIQAASWDDVIMAEDRKRSLIADVAGFFAGESTYKDFAVPWKVSLLKFFWS